MCSYFKNLEIVLGKIKSLKIQGASRIEKEARLALLKDLQKIEHSSEVKELKKELIGATLKLWSARPTEPAVRSIIFKFYNIIMQNKSKDTKQLSKQLIDFLQDVEKEKEEGMKKIGKEFVSLFDKEVVVFTHCHSHTVEFGIKELYNNGLLKYVINTETRPKFQGRITAENLVKAGIKVKHIVDSAAYSNMDKANVFVSGCDSILSTGGIVNKIGTTQISCIAEKFGIPHYVLTHINKFDPMSLYGVEPDLELRDPKEVWTFKNKNLEVVNYAFDLVPAYLIELFITDKGNFDPYCIGEYYLEHIKAYKFKEVFDIFNKK